MGIEPTFPAWKAGALPSCASRGKMAPSAGFEPASPALELPRAAGALTRLKLSGCSKNAAGPKFPRSRLTLLCSGWWAAKPTDSTSKLITSNLNTLNRYTFSRCQVNRNGARNALEKKMMLGVARTAKGLRFIGDVIGVMSVQILCRSTMLTPFSSLRSYELLDVLVMDTKFISDLLISHAGLLHLTNCSYSSTPLRLPIFAAQFSPLFQLWHPQPSANLINETPACSGGIDDF